MRAGKRNDSAGMVLIGVLLLLSVLTIGGIVGLTPATVRFRWGHARNVEKRLQYAAESGIGYARADLAELARTRSFTAPCDLNVTGPCRPVDSVDVGARVGLTAPFRPRKEFDTEGFRVSVFYFPSLSNEGNPADGADPAHNDAFPKQFRVVSRAAERRSGEEFSVEAMLEVRPQNYSEVALGMLGAGGPPQPSFVPAVYDGHVHFGMLGQQWRPHFGIGLTTTDIRHLFRGTVTFEEDVPAGTKPYTKFRGAEVIFEKGYRTNHPLNGYDADAIVQDLAANASTWLASWPGRSNHCLKFEPGWVELYDCVADAGPAAMVAATLDHGGERYGAYVAKTRLSGQTVIHCPTNCEVKGIYDAQVTVVAGRNIVLAGDLQAADQAENSPNRMALIARNNLVIPPQVGGRNAGGEGVTNFSVPRDRDGSPNSVRDLDLDAALWALGDGSQPNSRYTGILEVENFYNFAAGRSGMVVQGTDGNYYSLDSRDANYYYRTDPATGQVIRNENGIPLRKVDSLFCGNGRPPSQCPAGDEMMRPDANNLRIFGSLSVKNLSNLKGTITRPWNNGAGLLNGFASRVIRYNKGHTLFPPPHFPNTGHFIARQLWQKSYRGPAFLLAAAGEPYPSSPPPPTLGIGDRGRGAARPPGMTADE